MTRIPETELERLKNEVSVERLVEASGVELKRGGKDMLGRCPFHEDDTASLVVSPGKNLWHCFGCGAAGGPMDWVMKTRGVSFRHAVELLREGLPSSAAAGQADAAAPIKRTTVRALPPPVAFEADDAQLLGQVADYYAATLKQAPEALAYLASRGIAGSAAAEVIEVFKLGYANRTLGLRLPEKNRKAGAEIRARLERLGVYRDSGHEHLNGSLVIPLFDGSGPNGARWQYCSNKKEWFTIRVTPSPERRMARTKAVLGQGARLADYLSASLLARVVQPELVHEVLDAHGSNSQRLRSFPAVAGVYYCMALSLYPEAAYEEVFAVVARGLAWAAGAAEPARVAKSSISGLRSKIGAAPLADLVQRCCLPMADAKQYPAAFYAGLRLVALDGSNFELPDEADNVEHFGRPGSRTGVSGYPQAQCAVLVECATHAILGANIGPYRASEWEICAPLLARMGPGQLCLADRGFNGYEHWRQASATGAQLLWRCADNRQLPVVKALDDGSYLSAIYPSQLPRDKAREQAITVRVIEYALPGQEGTQPRYRLMTTLLDAAQAPALELAALYHQRWHVEAVFDELKTHLLQGRRVLRSKTAELVRQEFYGWVLAHYAVRWLLHQGAARQRLAHAELSFKGHAQLLRRAQPRSGAFPPRAAATPAALVR